jgi:transmembrane sensor
MPSPPQETALAAGQAIAVPREGHVSAVTRPATPETMTAGEIQRALAWQERRLDFVSVPLSTMVAEFNRYNRHKLVIADLALESQHFGGSFRADDPIGFVRVLEANFRVVAEPREGETHLRAAP